MRGKTVFVNSDGIFDIVPTKKKINANMITFGGRYPYVARGEDNNGIRGYINFDENFLNPANTISFGQDTATMNYQPIPYFTGDKIQIFKLNKKYGILTEKIALYLITSIKKAFSSFAWGQSSFALDVISYIKVPLPIDSKGNLDVLYMKDRIAELEQDRIAELDAYLKVTGLDDYELTDEDRKILITNNKKASFRKFKASDLFDIKKGKRLTKANMIDGNINFVGSSSVNNGITAKIGNTEYIHPAHTITVSYNGSVGEVFLQDEPFWASDDVNVWYPKFEFDTEIIEYIMAVIKKCRVKYNYASKWTIDKMRNETLFLPAKSDGEVDFDYMKRYIRAIEKITIADVVKYKNKSIADTKKSINAN